jgi:hypothetical protein
LTRHRRRNVQSSDGTTATATGSSRKKEDRLLARKALQRLQDPRHLQQARQLWATVASVGHSKTATTARSNPTVSFTTTMTTTATPWNVAPEAGGGVNSETRAYQTTARRRFPSSTAPHEVEDCSLALHHSVDTDWNSDHERHYHHTTPQHTIPRHETTTRRRRRRRRGAAAANAAAGPTATANTRGQPEKRKKNGNNNDSVYMCGVCGMIYSSLESATRHEEQHIQDVVAGIMGRVEDQHAAEPETASRRELEYWNGTLMRANEDDDDDDDDDDDGDDSIFGTSRGGANDNDDDDEHALLLSKEIRDDVTLADEALVDVVQRAIPFILTEAERDAEFELAALARDKAHYDELARRAAARHVNPTNRYRSDEHDWRGTVRNKLLDAYQIMKESDGQKGRTDQYQRAHRKVRVAGGTGATATQTAAAAHQNPPQHNNARTMYVNVMVKNSVSVVRHELERWACQRWEQRSTGKSSSQSPSPNTTLATTTTNIPAQGDLPLTRFEQFRHYTQRNVVKLAGIALASDFTVRLFNPSTKPMQSSPY